MFLKVAYILQRTRNQHNQQIHTQITNQRSASVAYINYSKMKKNMSFSNCEGITFIPFFYSLAYFCYAVFFFFNFTYMFLN